MDRTTAYILTAAGALAAGFFLARMFARPPRYRPIRNAPISTQRYTRVSPRAHRLTDFTEDHQTQWERFLITA